MRDTHDQVAVIVVNESDYDIVSHVLGAATGHMTLVAKPGVYAFAILVWFIDP